MSFEKLKAISSCPAIKKLFVEFQAGAAKHLVIEHEVPNLSKQKWSVQKPSNFVVSSTLAFQCSSSRRLWVGICDLNFAIAAWTLPSTGVATAFLDASQVNWRFALALTGIIAACHPVTLP